MKTNGRRDFLRRSGRAALVVLAAPSLLACGSGGPDCSATNLAEQTARTEAHYLDHTTSGARNCANCTFFTAGRPNACGTCSMSLGAVSPEGVCDRFAARA